MRNGRHGDAMEERIRWLKKKFELVQVQLALADEIVELEGCGPKSITEPEIYSLAPEELKTSHLY